MDTAIQFLSNYWPDSLSLKMLEFLFLSKQVGAGCEGSLAVQFLHQVEVETGHRMRQNRDQDYSLIASRVKNVIVLCFEYQLKVINLSPFTIKVSDVNGRLRVIIRDHV